jgi:hypothetical protein
MSIPTANLGRRPRENHWLSVANRACVSVGHIPEEEDTMTVYIICGDRVTARASAPAIVREGELVVGSPDEIAASVLSLARMVAVWNALPGTTAISKFKDRKTAAQRLWSAFARVPVDPEPMAGSADPRAGSKQAQVIGLLQRPEGATIDEMAAAMGWRRHTVRGLISGALKKKLGLPGQRARCRPRPLIAPAGAAVVPRPPRFN